MWLGMLEKDFFFVYCEVEFGAGIALDHISCHSVGWTTWRIRYQRCLKSNGIGAKRAKTHGKPPEKVISVSLGTGDSEFFVY